MRLIDLLVLLGAEAFIEIQNHYFGTVRKFPAYKYPEARVAYIEPQGSILVITLCRGSVTHN